jgi:hypothetical protein
VRWILFKGLSVKQLNWINYKCYLPVGLLFIMIGCAIMPSMPSKAEGLIGTWGFQDTTKGGLTLSFKEDLTYVVDYNNDGVADITGNFYFFEETIKFTDDAPRKETDCYEAGFHEYVLTNDLLRFKPFAEQCAPRKFILGLPLIRKF